MAFVSCSSCQRFVAPGDAVCPFCEAAVKHPPAPSKRLRVARSAMLAAAIAAGPACSTSTTPDDAGPGVDAAMMDAGAGADTGSTADAGSVDSGGSVDAGTDAFDAGMPLPPYGIPPMDAGSPDAEPPPAPLYGAPPAIDAG